MRASSRVVRSSSSTPAFAARTLSASGNEQAVALHHEAEDVAALAAAEALPRFAAGRHRERRRLLAVERAQALVRGPGLLQLDRLADDVDDAELALDFGCDADRQIAPPRLARRQLTTGRACEWACQVLTSRVPEEYHPDVNTRWGY